MVQGYGKSMHASMRFIYTIRVQEAELQWCNYCAGVSA